MKYNFNTHQLEIEDQDLLDLIIARFNAKELELNDEGYHYEWILSGSKYKLSKKVSNKKASDSDIAIFKAIQTFKKELGFKPQT